MKKVFKFVKGKKDERKEGVGGGGITPSQSGDLVSPARTPEDEAFLGLDNSGYVVDFSGKGKTLTKLHKAAWQGNLEKLKSALKKIEVDAVDRRNRTALHFAVAQGHPNIVWFLLGNNAKTSIADDEGNTPLLKAIECGHKDCMNLLLDRGADINVSDYTGNTGLHVAVDHASFDTVSVLLKKGADTEISNNAGDYPLHIATRLENKDLIDLLLDSGASVDVPDRENRTPLMLAAKTGNDVLVQTFVERGAQLTVVDSNGWTAQDYAMLGGRESVAASLKPLKKPAEKSEELEKSESWEDSQQEDNETVSVGQKLKNFVEKFSEEKEKDRNEDLTESPDAEPIPPYCQPPRSWEMIQAGMIDEDKDTEPKRRSITTLGTLHSRKESFTEGSVLSPHTLSLNRRKGAKDSNAFAKQRFSFNEEESLRYWTNEEKKIRKDLEKIELENMLTLAEPEGNRQSDNDWDSAEKSETKPPSDNGTLGRAGTLQGMEEVWVSHVRPDSKMETNSWDSEGSSEKEGSFPPPPTALELGVDMAKSIKYMKGISVDRPPGCAGDRNLWKNVRERRSLDCLEERDFVDKFVSVQCQKPTDRFSDVNRRINEQLECYDQALRELAESSKTIPPQNYYSLPSIKTGSGAECKRSNSQELGPNPPEEGPYSLPFFTEMENDEKPGAELLIGKSETRKTKRHMLLAMREVKHAVHVTNTFKTSMDDQILSPLAKPEDKFDLDGDASPKGNSKSSEGNSPPDENPFFGIGRQETVLERNGTARKSSSSGTEEESTLWLQDDSRKKELQGPNSDDDVPDIAADERSKHKRVSSFSPLGVIQREMEEESRKSKGYIGIDDESGRRFTGGKAPSPLGQLICGENEEQHEEIFREQSPDISLSSGPIEPLGAEKDSGSEPESSHNDVSPTHNYTFRSQHEWLKCHLKAATSEKNKLEELTAQLTEKTERLQYELADAKEAAKSRDEVIRLLQGQLARMEAAYTKSLEESVQSRLQLTSHEQEILHLKELCFRYEEEKEAAATCSGGDFLQDLKQKIKMLEEEREKMKEEIMHLEEEKLLLEKHLKQEKNEESEMIEDCQRWKERCRKLEERAKKHESIEENQEHFNQLRQQNFQLEKKFFELSEENVELKARIRHLGAELESERKKTKENVTNDAVLEMKKKNQEMEMKLKKFEKEMEENLVKKLKEKEEEVENLLKQFNRERDALVAAYERKLSEGKNLSETEGNGRGNHRLRQVVENLQDEVVRLRANASVEDVHATLRKELERLKDEWNLIAESQKDPQNLNALAMENLCREINDLKGKMSKDEGFIDVKSEILELKTQVNSLRTLLDGGRWPAGNQKRFEGKKRLVEKEDELAWSNLYGMKSTRQRRDGRSTSVTETLMKHRAVEGSSDDDVNEMKKRKESGEKLEFLELKKEIISLQSKMLDEKNLRHALENQMIKMNLDLSEKDNLEKEVNSLKRKIDRDFLTKSEVELLGFQKDLEARREKYVEGEEGCGAGENFKAKCEILAKERERSKRMRSTFGRRARSFDCPPLESPPQPKFHSFPRPLPELFFQPRYVALDPDIKHKLERKLDKSIKKYVQDTSTPSISTAQLELVKKTILNERK